MSTAAALTRDSVNRPRTVNPAAVKVVRVRSNFVELIVEVAFVIRQE